MKKNIRLHIILVLLLCLCMILPQLTGIVFALSDGNDNVVDTADPEATLLCGKMAHIHTDICYDKVLLCDYWEFETEEPTEEAVTEESETETEETVTEETEIEEFETQETVTEESVTEETEALESVTEESALETSDTQEPWEEISHEHTDDCYASVLICDLDSHEHSEACYILSLDNEINAVADEIIDYDSLDTDTVYYRINGQGEYKKNDGSKLTVYLGDEIELLAVVDGPTMNGDMPDTGASGFLPHPWAQDSGAFINVSNIADQWSKADPNNESDKKWVAKATATLKKTGDGKIICLAVNGTLDKDTLTLNIGEAPSLIHIHNVQVGNMNYDYIDTDIATRMLSGINTNSESNPYILYVGYTLDLSAIVPGSFSLTVNASVFKELNGDYLDDITLPEGESGVVAAKTKYLALKPGKCKITFTAEDGRQEIFWVQIHYPIFVKTAVRELHKNRVHEYLDIISGRWKPTWLLTDPSGTPIYVRNLGDDDFETRYLMYTDDTVILVGYALPEDNAEFKILSAGVEIIGDSLVVETEEINGVEYSKTTAEFRVTTSGLKEISFGSADKTETFYINVRNTDDGTIQHCDIEIADAGAYVDTKTEDLGGGKMKITETSYKVEVTGAKQCTVHGETINPGTFNGAGSDHDVYIIPGEQYGIYGTQTDTQFEFSSAFGVSIGSDGKRYSNAGLGLVGRSIKNIGTITSVVFELYLSLNPNTETVRIIDSDGNDLESEIYNISDREPIQETRTAVMDSRDILDALNKCPDHSGLDFDVKIASFKADITLRAQKDFNAGSLERDDTFTFEVYKSTSIVDYEGLKAIGVFDTVSVNFKEGGTKEIAFDTLVSDEDEAIGSEGKTFRYYIKEVIPDTLGDIIYDDNIFRTDITVINNNGSLNMKRANYIWEWKDENDHSKGGAWVKFTTDNYPTFKNKVSTICEPPLTGGAGIYLYIIPGIALLLTAGILISKQKQKAAYLELWH